MHAPLQSADTVLESLAPLLGLGVVGTVGLGGFAFFLSGGVEGLTNRLGGGVGSARPSKAAGPPPSFSLPSAPAPGPARKSTGTVKMKGSASAAPKAAAAAAGEPNSFVGTVLTLVGTPPRVIMWMWNTLRTRVTSYMPCFIAGVATAVVVGLLAVTTLEVLVVQAS